MNTKCPHCGCPYFYRDWEGDMACLNCNFPLPSPHAKHQLLEVNKREVVFDLANLGLAKTLEKWRVSRVTLKACLKRWQPEALTIPRRVLR